MTPKDEFIALGEATFMYFKLKEKLRSTPHYTEEYKELEKTLHLVWDSIRHKAQEMLR
jgi:hypothetical protein